MRPERLYAALLRAYPKPHRDAHGPELLATLAETSPDRISLHESTALLRGGFLARLRQPADRPALLDGLAIGLLAITLQGVNGVLPGGGSVTIAEVLGALLPLAIMRGWAFAAFGLALVAAAKVAKRTYFDPDTIPYGAGHYPLVPAIVGIVVLVGGCGILAFARLRGARTARRSWLWLVWPLQYLPFTHWGGHFGGMTTFMTQQYFLPMLLLLIATLITADRRWAIGAALYCTYTLSFWLYQPFALMGQFPISGFELTFAALTVAAVALSLLRRGRVPLFR
ncbi:hypothetical protein GCM10027589_47730 [Actinocorallia lasiicapitis]